MQTFVPFPDFTLSLACLDNKRLAEQRVEALTVHNVLTGKLQGWQQHPVVKMWEGYANALAWYYEVACQIWKKRGFQHNMIDMPLSMPVSLPPWIGDRRLHLSHQSLLLRKDEAHYRIWFGPDVPKNLECFWPAPVSRFPRGTTF